MIRFTWTFLLAVATFAGWSQGTMNIHLSGAPIVLLDIGAIDSVVYQLLPPPAVMLVYGSDGSLLSYETASIDSITYSPAGPLGSAQVATLSPIPIGNTVALCSGVIGDEGDSPVSERGICFGTDLLPDLNGTVVAGFGATNIFQAQLPGLQPGVIYYARAYAINAQGTSFGNQVSFTTDAAYYLNPSLSYGSMTDQDGNTYATIIIGGQEWMAENLRTTHYNDGSLIPNVTDYSEWIQLSDGAWCNYGNNSDLDGTFGKLYNWYAAENPNICPQDWHVPTDGEWQQLEASLGMQAAELTQLGTRGVSQNVGAKMIATSGWSPSNSSATNECGFSALPGGQRVLNWDWQFLYSIGIWWSVSESTAFSAWYRHLTNASSGIFRSDYGKREGLSLRCVRD